MTDTAEDRAVGAIERRARATRETEPCDDFGPMSRSVQLCDLCGWDFAAHVDRDHALELDEDKERTAP